MNKSPIIVAFSAFLLTFVSSVNADDLEIYEAISNAEVATGDGQFDPNLLFVLDNSGSMRAWNPTLIEDRGNSASVYDPNFDYIPRDSNGVAEYDEDDFYLYTTTGSFITQVNADLNNCQAARQFFLDNPANPVFQDTFLQWRQFNSEDGWSTNVTFSNNAGRVVECENDNGVHGANGASEPFLDFCRAGQCRNDPQYRSTQLFDNSGDRLFWDNSTLSERQLVTANYRGYLDSLIDVLEGSKCLNEHLMR